MTENGDFVLLIFFIIGPLLGSLYLLTEYKLFGGFSLAIAIIGLIILNYDLKKHNECDSCKMKAVREDESKRMQQGIVERPLANVVLASSIILRPKEDATGIWAIHLYDRDDYQTEMRKIDESSPKPGSSNSMAGLIVDGKHQADGILVATNMRLIFARGSPSIQSYQTTQSFDMGDVIGLSARGIQIELLVRRTGSNVVFLITEPCEVQRSSLNKMNRISVDQFATQVSSLVKTGLEFIEAEKSKANVHYILDFSFLKAEMEKGGLVVQSVKCPNCSASLALPQTGNSTKCEYCGSTILAQDIFDKVKGMIKQM